MAVPSRCVIATRESPLALWQAEYVRDVLSARYANTSVELLGMTTRGEVIRKDPELVRRYVMAQVEAIARMKRTLEMSVVEGIRTTIPLHLKILNDADFVAGRLSTAFMDRYQPKPKPASLAESA